MIPPGEKVCMGQRNDASTYRQQIFSKEYLLYALQTSFMRKTVRANPSGKS